jgi:hypothetical protein
MNKAMNVISTITFATCLLVVSGCSEESQDKWEKAGSAVGDAAKETAQEAKEGVKEVVKNAKPTDPDTGQEK